MSSRLNNLLNSYPLNPAVIWKNILWRFPRHKSEGSYIFIVGSPRSGTTLLQTMLIQHSQLFSIQGETGILSYKNIFDPQRNHFRLPANRSLALLNQCSDVIEFFDACVKEVNQGQKEKRFVEKTPQHVLHLAFILKWFPEASILHIVRDGRDCYCSSKINIDIPQNSSVDVFAKYWRKCVSQPIKYSNQQRVHTIKYEDLVASPKSQLVEVMKLLDLKFEHTQVDTTQFTNDPRAKRIEFKRLAGEINTKSTRRWKKELTAAEVAQFEKIAKDQLKYYGYE